MSSVDSRIVTMKFDNKQFEEGVHTTISSMDKLKNSLNTADSAKGLGVIADGASKVSAGFIAMSAVAITALSNITNKVIDTGTQMVKSLTLDPVMAGFQEYELKMGAIQTIMAGSGESMDVVNQKLKELNTYSDKTIYSFKDMTSNIGKFTNAGVSLDDSVAAIKGVANVAALSGANAEEASRAMYNFAQSISSGSVKLMDWKSIELANMATVEFKTELMESAVAAGKLTKSADGMYTTLEGTPISATKGFNESLQEQWLTSEALTETLGRYSDETTDIGKRATAAATEVKTFTQLMDTLKESAGSGWAETSEIVIGNFEEAKALWTGVNNTIGGMISASADARNKVLTEWKSAGGRDVLLEGLKNAFDGLMSVIKPIKEAFREIFPAKTGADLYKLTVQFRNFTEKLKLSEETSKNLKNTFKGVFAVFSIIGQIIGGVISVFTRLIGSVAGGTGGFLAFTGGIGEFLVKIDAALKKGDLIKNFFDVLGAVLTTPIELVKMLGGFIADLFTGFDGGVGDNMSDAMGNIGQSFKDLGIDISDSLGSIGDLFEKIVQKIQPVIDWIKEALSGFWDAVAEAFTGGNSEVIFGALGTGLFAMLIFRIRSFFSGDLLGSLGITDLFESITGVFTQLTDCLKTMQQSVQATTILKIAIAVGILAISLVALALIDPARLAAATAAITTMFIELLAAMKILSMISGTKGFKDIPKIALGMILLSVAVLILSHAVQNLAELDWDELARGLLGVAGLIGILVVAMKPLSKNATSMVKAGVSLIVLALGLKALASAVKDFADMSWGEIGQGLVAVAGALGIIAGAMRLMPKNMALTAVSIMVLSVSLKVLASAVKDFADMSWGEIGQGLAGLAGSLVVIAGAMRMMPKNMALTAVSLAVTAISLKLLADVLKDLGGMTWEEIARGLVALAGSLVILSVGLRLMSGTLMGSAALVVAALALAVLTPILKVLGGMEWEEIAKGLAALAGVFVVLGVAGYLLGPVVPIIAALSLAILAIGAAMLIAGVGMLAFATAFTLLAAIGTAAAATITLILGAIIAKIPEFMASIAQGIVDFARTLGEGATTIATAMGQIISAVVNTIITKTPEVLRAFVTMLTAMLNGVIILAPKMGQAATVVINTFLQVIRDTIPNIVQTGLSILLAVLRGIGNNMYQIVTAAAKIITEFLRGIGDNAPKVMNEGAKTVVKFIDGLTAAIRNNRDEVNRAGWDLAKEIIKGMASGLTGGLGMIKDAAKNVAKSALDGAKSLLGIKSPSKAFMDIGKFVDEGFAMGIDTYAKIVDTSVEEMGDSALTTMQDTMSRIADAVATDVEMTPVITPVLDLSQVQSDASQISTLLSNKAATVSYNQAALISANQMATQTEALDSAVTAQPTLINFEQNNMSPKALSTVEIYRQTKNQLSLAKEALKV